MSLRDQLLKAGLADKKKVKKASKAAKKAAYEKLKTQDEPDEVKREIEEKRLAQKELDKKLNEKIQKERLDKQKHYQAIDLVLSRDLSETNRKDNEAYYFLTRTNHIKAIGVSDIQRMLLENGELGIVGVEDRYFLLQASDYERIAQLNAELLVCLHQKDQESKDPR